MKGRSKTPLFTDNSIFYTENHKMPPKTCQNKFSEAAGHKINIQKSVAFLYMNNKVPQREIKKTIPLTLASRRMKYLGINSTKEVKERYTENSKTRMKQTEDTNKWTDIRCSQNGRIIALKCPHYQNHTNSMQSLSKVQWHFPQKKNHQSYNL